MHVDISLAEEKYLNIISYVYVHNFYFFVQIRHKQLYYTVHTPCSASLEFQLMTSSSSTLPEMPSPYPLSSHGCCIYFANCDHMQQYFFFFFTIHLFYIVWREGQGRYELLTMVGAGGTRTCVHPHVSRPLYHCATDADTCFTLQGLVWFVLFNDTWSQ